MNSKQISIPLLLIVFLFLSGCWPVSDTIKPTNDFMELLPTQTLEPTIGTLLTHPSVTPELAIPYPYPGISPDISEAYPLPYPVEMPTVGASSTPPIRPSETPEPTITPTFTSTATLLPYTGKPFTIVFIRDGNLWLAEIGGKGERQLTQESGGWWVYRFDLNRRGNRIAYIALKGQFPDVINGMIKQLDLRTGEITPLIGMGDRLLEENVRWLDDTHLAYTYTEWPANDKDTSADLVPLGEYHPYNYFIFNLKSSKKTYILDAVDISQSPDGRYLLTCISSYPYEPVCKFRLLELKTDQTHAVAEDSVYGWFKGWSFDSKWMLFANGVYAYGDVQTDRKYLIVDPVSRLNKWVLVRGTFCVSVSWAFRSAVFAGCEIEDGMQIHFWGSNGKHIRPSIHLTQQFRIVSWTPDDTRLVLVSEDETLWIINIDGTGLQQILNNSKDWIVLPKSGG